MPKPEQPTRSDQAVIAAMRREEAAAIGDLFEAYAAALDDFDSGGVLDLFQYPCVIWQFDKGYVFADEDELAENVAALFRVYEREGIVHSDARLEECAVIGPAAVARLAWTQYDAAGEPVFAFDVSYHLVKQSGDWFIATVVNEDMDDTPPLPPIPAPPQ